MKDSKQTGKRTKEGNGGANYKRLMAIVTEASEADDFKEAVKEWDITGVDIDEHCESKCICGKESIKYLFTIGNRKNGNELEPIGSTCIKRFGRVDMDEIVAVCESLYRLSEQSSNKNPFRDEIRMDGDSFSRKMLSYMYDHGAFQPSKYNGYDPSLDYKFCVKMFNKTNKDRLTEKQKAKLRVMMDQLCRWCRENYPASGMR